MKIFKKFCSCKKMDILKIDNQTKDSFICVIKPLEEEYPISHKEKIIESHPFIPIHIEIPDKVGTVELKIRENNKYQRYSKDVWTGVIITKSDECIKIVENDKNGYSVILKDIELPNQIKDVKELPMRYIPQKENFVITRKERKGGEKYILIFLILLFVLIFLFIRIKK